MKLVMMGTGPFAVPTFDALAASEHSVECLITRPDKRARGRKKAPPNPMRDAATNHGIPVFAPNSINSEEGLALLDQMAADLLVVCDYGQILSDTALGKAKWGGINLHGSLLPRYRGAAPINHALLQGDTVAGITVIHMTPRLDGGPMLCTRSLPIQENENAAQLEPRLAKVGVAAVFEALEMLGQWDGQSSLGVTQQASEVTKAPRLKKSDGLMDWSRPATAVSNQVRALQPWPGTYSSLLRDGKPGMRVIIREVSCATSDRDGLRPGDAYESEDGIIVQCGQGALCIPRIQPAGKREMDAAEFARGYGKTLRFGTDEGG